MRRIALIAGLLALGCALAGVTAFVWVGRALAVVQARGSSALCLTPKDRQKIDARAFPQDRRDLIVSKAINFNQGRSQMLWWHLRGATIHATYVTFWSPSQRDGEFQRLASKLRDCPPSLF